MLGVAFGVLLGDLRAVGGAVQNELFIPRGLADRLDVFRRFLGGVAAARRSDFERAAFERLARRAAEAAQRGAAQRIRGAGAALVEDEQVACT